MKEIRLGKSEINVPAIIIGCMRMDSIDENNCCKFIDYAMENGLNYFDHADIYGGGKCEELFGKAWRQCGLKREDMFLQSKCGIRDGFYDFSKKYILESVDGSLKRLGVDYLDSLLLHRPDMLMEPEEVAEAVDVLIKQGKIRYFGVSNQKPMQIELLKKYLNQPIMANQLQLSITNANMIGNGIYVNMECEGATDRDGSVLDYCRLNDITIQAWSPFQYGFFEGVFLGSEKYGKLNVTIKEIAKKYSVSDTAIATAWILRHPAGIQMISGTMKTKRLKQIIEGVEVNLTRKEWYDIYLAAGNMLP
jgi:predicted oxidoreductase